MWERGFFFVCHGIRFLTRKKIDEDSEWHLLPSILICWNRPWVVEGDGILIFLLAERRTTCWTLCMWTTTLRFWTTIFSGISAFSKDPSFILDDKARIIFYFYSGGIQLPHSVLTLSKKRMEPVLYFTKSCTWPPVDKDHQSKEMELLWHTRSSNCLCARWSIVQYQHSCNFFVMRLGIHCCYFVHF